MKRIICIFSIGVILFSACSKNEIELSTLDQTLYAGETCQIKAKTTNGSISYKSENEFHAIVSNSGLIKAQRMGETSIVLDNGDETKKIRVVIKPRITLYPEPCLQWGTTREVMLNKFGVPDANSTSGILYDNYSSKAPIVMYNFDENDKLDGTIVLIKIDYSSYLGGFLGERYYYVGNSSDYTLYLVNALTDNDVTMIVGAKLYNLNYWMIIYAPVETPSNSKSSKLIDDEILKKAKELMGAKSKNT